MLCVCIAMGLAKGVRTVYMSLVIPTHVPIERLAAASGLQMVMNGAVLIIFGPIVGEYNQAFQKLIIIIVQYINRTDSRYNGQLLKMHYLH